MDADAKVVHRQTVLQVTIPVSRFTEEALVEALGKLRSSPATLQSTFALQVSEDESYDQPPVTVGLQHLSRAELLDAYRIVTEQRAQALANYASQQKQQRAERRRRRGPKR